MKRMIIVLVISLMCGFAANSKDNPVSVVSGDISILKQVKTAVVEFDYSQMYIDGVTEEEYLAAQDDGYRADWPGVKSDSEVYFCPMFNKYIKSWTTSSLPGSEQYRIVVQINALSLGNMGQMFNPFSGVKAGGGEISGKLFFVNVETGHTECVVAFTGVKGLTGFTEATRWGSAYMYLAKALGKLAKQAK